MVKKRDRFPQDTSPKKHFPWRSYSGATATGQPDIRIPETNEEFQRLNAAYKDVTGEDCPQLAIGGGTDAKGVLTLLAAGPLFSTRMGPPINYHGKTENGWTANGFVV